MGYRIPKANRKAGAKIRSRLQRLGLLRETGHESLRGCITMPLLDEHGAVVSAYGRRLDARAVASPDVYVSTKGLFNVEAFNGNRQTFVCSSVFDALVMWSNGVRAVTAVHDGNLDELVDAIVKSGIVRVTRSFPRTDEGQKWAAQLKDRLSGAEVEVFRALLPAGMNVQSFTTSSATAPKALATVVRQAEWIGGVRPPSPSPAALMEPVTTSTTTAISAAAATTTGTTPATNTGDLIMDLGDRRWRIRGLGNNLSYERLRVHLFVSRDTLDSRTSGFFVDTIELYSARQRNAFVEQAAEELGLDADIMKRDLGHVLLRLEALQDEQIRAALAPKTPVPMMTDREREYLTLIRTIALLHQHQREMKRLEHEGATVEYIEVVPEDIAVADRLMAETLATTDELPPHTRHVLGLLDGMVMTVCEERGLARADYRFTRRQARERLGIGGTQLWLHLKRLVEAEYVVVHPSRHGRGVVYELAVDGVGPERTIPIVRGDAGPNSGVVRPSFGPDSGEIRGAQTSASPEETRSIDAHVRDREDRGIGAP